MPPVLFICGFPMLANLIDFILHIDQHLIELTQTYGLWIYAILFLIVFCETGLVVTPFLPGDSLLFAAGAVAALGGMNVHIAAALLLAAAVIGDAVNFAIGKYFGEKLFAKPDSRVFKREYLDKTHAFYEKYGGKTIILARFVPIVRTFAPFVAGMGNMHYGRFIRYNIIGALMWVGLLTYAGYFFGELPVVKNNFGLVVIGIIVVSVLPMAVEIAKANWGKKA
jgi:hypothetical protein